MTDETTEEGPAGVVARFLALADLSSTVSDALDSLGLGSGIAGLSPVAEDQRVCGPAVTLRYVAEPGDAADRRAAGEASRLGDRALFSAAPRGAVAVIDCGGRRDVAALGGIGAAVASAAGLAGIVVDGAVRDTATLRQLDLGIWCRGRSPVSGRHRLATAESGGVVAVRGVPVRPGDLVVADGTGICVVPRARAPHVVDVCEAIERDEDEILAGLTASLSGR